MFSRKAALARRLAAFIYDRTQRHHNVDWARRRSRDALFDECLGRSDRVEVEKVNRYGWALVQPMTG
jgi:hypothetical protein